MVSATNPAQPGAAWSMTVEAQAALLAMRQSAGTRAAQLREGWTSPMLT